MTPERQSIANDQKVAHKGPIIAQRNTSFFSSLKPNMNCSAAAHGRTKSQLYNQQRLNPHIHQISKTRYASHVMASVGQYISSPLISGLSDSKISNRPQAHFLNQGNNLPERNVSGKPIGFQLAHSHQRKSDSDEVGLPLFKLCNFGVWKGPELGRGYSGVVHRGVGVLMNEEETDVRDSRPMALKLSKPKAIHFGHEVFGAPGREFETLRFLYNNHVPVPRPLGFCISSDDQGNGRTLLVMDLVDGVTLREWINNQTGMVVRHAASGRTLHPAISISAAISRIDVAIGLIEALESLHRFGVFVDLKPRNIMVGNRQTWLQTNGERVNYGTKERSTECGRFSWPVVLVDIGGVVLRRDVLAENKEYDTLKTVGFPKTTSTINDESQDKTTRETLNENCIEFEMHKLQEKQGHLNAIASNHNVDSENQLPSLLRQNIKWSQDSKERDKDFIFNVKPPTETLDDLIFYPSKHRHLLETTCSYLSPELSAIIVESDRAKNSMLHHFHPSLIERVIYYDADIKSKSRLSVDENLKDGHSQIKQPLRSQSSLQSPDSSANNCLNQHVHHHNEQVASSQAKLNDDCVQSVKGLTASSKDSSSWLTKAMLKTQLSSLLNNKDLFPSQEEDCIDKEFKECPDDREDIKIRLLEMSYHRIVHQLLNDNVGRKLSNNLQLDPRVVIKHKDTRKNETKQSLSSTRTTSTTAVSYTPLINKKQRSKSTERQSALSDTEEWVVHIGEKSSIFSLGLILCELFGGLRTGLTALCNVPLISNWFSKEFAYKLIQWEYSRCVEKVKVDSLTKQNNSSAESGSKIEFKSTAQGVCEDNNALTKPLMFHTFAKSVCSSTRGNLSSNSSWGKSKHNKVDLFCYDVERCGSYDLPPLTPFSGLSDRRVDCEFRIVLEWDLPQIPLLISSTTPNEPPFDLDTLRQMQRIESKKREHNEAIIISSGTLPSNSSSVDQLKKAYTLPKEKRSCGFNMKSMSTDSKQYLQSTPDSTRVNCSTVSTYPFSAIHHSSNNSEVSPSDRSAAFYPSDYERRDTTCKRESREIHNYDKVVSMTSFKDLFKKACYPEEGCLAPSWTYTVLTKSMNANTTTDKKGYKLTTLRIGKLIELLLDKCLQKNPLKRPTYESLKRMLNGIKLIYLDLKAYHKFNKDKNQKSKLKETNDISIKIDDLGYITIQEDHKNSNDCHNEYTSTNHETIAPRTIMNIPTIINDVKSLHHQRKDIKPLYKTYSRKTDDGSWELLLESNLK